MQARFLAALRIAAAKQEQVAASQQAEKGRTMQAFGAGLGFLVGGPPGAAAGAKAGGSIG